MNQVSSKQNVGPSDEKSSAREGEPQDYPKEDVAVLDTFVAVIRNLRVIVWTTVVVTTLGVTYSLLAPEEYTATAKVVRDSENTNVGQFSRGLSTLQGLGFNVGSSSGEGLVGSTFLEVLRSREVRLAVVRDTFSFPDAERPMTFVEYANRPPGPFGILMKYTVRLPWTLKNGLSNLLLSEGDTTGVGPDSPYPTERESKALERIRPMAQSSFNRESGIVSISVRARGPELSTKLTESFVDHLTRRVREIRTRKIRERLNFLQDRFQEVQNELDEAEERLAQFLERNQNPTTATLQFQQERLQRQVRFKEQLYENLQSQLTQTRIDLQRRQPVVTVIEKPAPPMFKTAPQRTLITIVSFVFGLVLGGLLSYGKSAIEENDKVKQNVEKVKSAVKGGI